MRSISLCGAGSGFWGTDTAAFAVSTSCWDACNLSGSTTGLTCTGDAASDISGVALAAAEPLVVLTAADDAVVDVVLDDEKLGVISAVAGRGWGVRTGSVTTGAIVSGGYSVVVAYAVSLAASVGSYGGSSARAGTIPADSAVKEIAAPKASTTAAPRHKPMRRGAFILAQPLSSRGGVGPRN
jgi:hypothetical protein